MADKIIHLTSKAQHDELIKGNPGKIVLIDFHATWCGPCHMIAPEYQNLANANPGIIFTKVDVDAVPELSEQYGIRAMPTFKVVKDGNETDELRGASKDKLNALIEKHKA
ncbi:hypothetical protein RSOLAG22IIIB_03052 [Rhizoctonia solani]|uniref:Thioredoxin n=1 Tax=Rhizoctonia solani TaxID=456999 RepID=A0A0K6FN61_9AGAM|nr:hypothetical protein RSOLAG22IIIB_03052 [Rhizoctonia solani]